MCESCESFDWTRREFVLAAGALGATGVMASMLQGESVPSLSLRSRDKAPARVRAVFLYPPAEVVLAGQNEDSWAPHKWFTWPGNQFEPAEQEKNFTRQIHDIARRLGMIVLFDPIPLYQEAKVEEFIARTRAESLDAVLVINFWNTFSAWSYQIATEAAPTAIVYQPVGSSHQLPPEKLRRAEGVFYIHSIENWDEIENGLRAVRARKMLAQSRLLRVSDQPDKTEMDPWLGLEVIHVSAGEFNDIFDSIKPDNALIRQAHTFKKQAVAVRDVDDNYFAEAMRSHQAVGQILARYGADAVTIQCLMLQHRKPCLSFALNNGSLIPCGCENDYNATQTLMLGRWLFERAGFQHNPDYDISRNRYYGSHCTCALKLHGPEGLGQKYGVRPFFHQLPKTAALDVQWTPGESVVLAKCLGDKNTIAAWTGKVIESPTCPPAGGCATRVLVELDKLTDVCQAYAGPHPILFCVSSAMARRLKVFSGMYKITLQGNM